MEKVKSKLTILDQITASDKVRSKIIDAASELYAKKGFASTSIQEISEMAGVDLPITYHYVKNKSEIMRMIMEDVLSTFQDSLRKEIQDLHDPEEKLHIAIILYLRIIERQRDKLLLIYQKSSSLEKAAKARIMQLEVDVADIFKEIIREGISQGTYKSVDVDLMAYNIMMLAHMWILKHWHFKKRLTLDKYIDLQLGIIMNALH